MSDPGATDFDSFPILDDEQIGLLMVIGEAEGPETINELLGLFLNENPERVQEMKAALAAGDLEEVAKNAHSISGASANMGGMRLAKVAKALQVAVLEGNVDRVGPLTQLVEDNFQVTVDALRSAFTEAGFELT